MQSKGKDLPITLPKGVKDFLPEMAGRMCAIDEKLARTFELWGYRKVVTPYIEYLDVLALAEPGLQDRMFKFEDRASGRMLALRPDITAQIARLSASHLKDHARPLRLHYNGSVLHYGERDKGGSREIYQSGLELIGLEQAEADGEIIAVAIEALKSVGLRDFKIDVGQVEFFRGVMEGLKLPEEVKKDVEEAVARKDRSGIEDILPSLRLKDRDAEVLLALPSLFGDRTVLGRAESMTADPRAGKALENLFQVLDTVDSYGLMDFITVDLGEIRGLNYYTGVIFEGFVSGLGEEICGGGRYDTLHGRYGHNAPATGFAVNLETLLRGLEVQGVRPEPGSAHVLIVNKKNDRDEALKVARSLREKGVRVAREIEKRDIDSSVSYAKSESMKKVVVLGGSDMGDDELMLIDLENDVKMMHKTADLISGKVHI